MGGKRGQNKGSIRWLENGSLELRATDPATGKQRSRSVRPAPKTSEEAQIALRDFVRELEAGVAPSAGRRTVAAYLQEWLEESVKPLREAKTYEGYRHLARLYIVPEIGHVQLQKLTVQHVQKMFNGMLKRGLSARTINNTRAVLRRALNMAVRWGLIPRNPVLLTEVPTVRPVAVEPLDAKTALKIVEATRKDRLGAMFLTMLALGLRPGEAYALRWEDVDLDKGTLRVKHTLTRVDGVFQLKEPKTPWSKRTLPLPGVVRDALRAHRTRQLHEILMATDWEKRNLVFCTVRGTPLDESNVDKRFKKALRDADLPPMRVYDLRHGALSFLASLGAPLHVLIAVAGHASPEMLKRVYLHATESDMQKAMAGMDQLLGGAG